MLTYLIAGGIALGIGVGALTIGYLMAMDIRANHADDKHNGWEEGNDGKG